MKRIITLLILLLASFHASASIANGRELLEGINNPDVNKRLIVMGYIIGAFDTSQEFLHCAPDLEPENIIELIKQVLENTSPSKLASMPGDYFIVMPFRSAYPCKDKNTI